MGFFTAADLCKGGLGLGVVEVWVFAEYTYSTPSVTHACMFDSGALLSGGNEIVHMHFAPTLLSDACLYP